jgi:uridine kinase
MSAVKVVGVAGYKLSGKDTFCGALTLRFPKVVRLAVADEIKRELAKFLGITIEQIEMFKEPHYRKPLQDLASARRRVDENYWFSRLSDQIRVALDCGARVVVPDLRLPHETERLRALFGAKIVRLHRASQGAVDNHETERHVDKIVADETYTCGSPEEVRNMAYSYGQFIGWGSL